MPAESNSIKNFRMSPITGIKLSVTGKIGIKNCPAGWRDANQLPLTIKPYHMLQYNTKN